MIGLRHGSGLPINCAERRSRGDRRRGRQHRARGARHPAGGAGERRGRSRDRPATVSVGSAPTVTDANLVLGYLDPRYFLGGARALDPDAARAAIEEHVAKPLGVGLTEAAWGVHQLVTLNMEGAIRARVHRARQGSAAAGRGDVRGRRPDPRVAARAEPGHPPGRGARRRGRGVGPRAPRRRRAIRRLANPDGGPRRRPVVPAEPAVRRDGRGGRPAPPGDRAGRRVARAAERGGPLRGSGSRAGGAARRRAPRAGVPGRHPAGPRRDLRRALRLRGDPRSAPRGHQLEVRGDVSVAEAGVRPSRRRRSGGSGRQGGPARLSARSGWFRRLPRVRSVPARGGGRGAWRPPWWRSARPPCSFSPETAAAWTRTATC